MGEQSWIDRLELHRDLSLNEFDGSVFSSSGPFQGPVVKTGQEALVRFGLDGKLLEDVIGAQTKITAGCWLMSFVGLTFTGQKFAVTKVPSAE